MSLITAEWMKPIRVRRRKEFVIVGVRHSKDAGNHSRLDMHTTHAYKVHHPIQSFKDTHTACKFFFSIRIYNKKGNCCLLILTNIYLGIK